MNSPALPDRRHFLATLLGTGAAAFTASRAAALSYKGENLRYGLVTYQWGADWPLPVLLANCEQAGVLGVELRVVKYPKGTKADPDELPPAMVREMLATAPTVTFAAEVDALLGSHPRAAG
jgi:hypothetical protein